MSTKKPVVKHPLADIDKTVHSPARLMLLAYLYVVESAEYIFLVNMTGLTWVVTMGLMLRVMERKKESLLMSTGDLKGLWDKR